MKKRKLVLPSIALALVAAFGLAACNTSGKPAGQSQGGENQSQQGSGDEVSLGEIVVTAEGNKVDLLVGETVQLHASVEGVSWKSRTESVATVDANGLVTAVGAGTVKIRAEKDGYDTGSINITVTKAPEKEAHTVIDLEHADHYSPNDIWGMDLSAYGMGFMGPGDSPVEDNGGATEDGHSLGWLQQGCKETLTFTSNKAAEVEIGVSMAYNQEMNLATAISVKFNNVAIDMTGKVCEGPEDGDSNNYYDWHTTSFGKVNLVQGNNVLEIEMIGQGPNMDVFKVYSEDKELVITVVEPVAKPQITVTPTEKELEVGDTVQLVTETAGVSYVSSAPTVASVSETGLVTALAMGKATITVSKEGMKKATVAITVKAKPVAGQIVLEAEDAIVADDATIQFENSNTASGGKSLGYFSAGQTFSLEYTAEAAKEMKLSIVAAACEMAADYSGIMDMNLATAMSLTLNGTAISLADKTLSGNTSWNFQNWQEIDLGNVNLVAGKNTFVFTALAQGPNIDCIKLTDPNAQVTPPAPVTYTVSFAAGEGATGTMDPVEREAGEYTLPECTFTAPAGMVFAGWSVPVNQWWSQTYPAGEKINISAAVTLTATWVKENVTVTFAAGEGATGTMDPVSVKSGEYTLPECTFTAPEGKVFAGWLIQINQWQSQVKGAGEKITLSDNMTITATWKTPINKTAEVDLTNAVYFEAEDATIAGAQTQQGGSPVEDNESSHGGKDVGYMAAGASITFKFNASAAGKVRLVLMGRSASADWSQYPNVSYYDHPLDGTTSIKVNGGADLNVANKGFLGSDAKTSVQVDLGEIDVVEGENTIVITALQQAPNFDCIALIGSASVVISAIAA